MVCVRIDFGTDASPLRCCLVFNVKFSGYITFINAGLGTDCPNPSKKNKHPNYDEDEMPPWELPELVEVH
jgi:hypothetical protein